MNQTTHEQSGAGLSQCDLVLLRLRHALQAAETHNVPVDWVSLPDLVQACGGYAVHSRVADLRRRGHDIEQMSVHRAGKVHSFYRLKGTH